VHWTAMLNALWAFAIDIAFAASRNSLLFLLYYTCQPRESTWHAVTVTQCREVQWFNSRPLPLKPFAR